MNDLVKFQAELKDDTASTAVANVIHGIDITNNWITRLRNEVSRLHGDKAEVFLYTGIERNKLQVKIKSKSFALGKPTNLSQPQISSDNSETIILPEPSNNKTKEISENVAKSATYLNYWFKCLCDEANRLYDDAIDITMDIKVEPSNGKYINIVEVNVKIKDVQIV